MSVALRYRSVGAHGHYVHTAETDPVQLEPFAVLLVSFEQSVFLPLLARLCYVGSGWLT